MQNLGYVSEDNNNILDKSGKFLIDSELLNETAVSPVKVDASTTKTSRRRFALNNFLSRTSLDLGNLNSSKLTTFYQSHYEQSSNGEVICLASISKNSQLTINPEALKLLRQYEKNEITFIGNIGKKESGKSFWYDKLLNLSEVQGAQYSKIKTDPGLYIWSVPFVKNNLRIFLLDCSNQNVLGSPSSQDQMLTDLEMILSEALVLVPDPDDKKLKVSDSVYTSLNQSMSRLIDKGSKTNKQTPYWPSFFYTLYRSIKSVSPQNDKLSYLFANYNYSIIHNALNKKVNKNVSQLALMESSMVNGQNSSQLLNQTYVKRSSLVFKDIYKKLHGKTYEGLKFTGDVLPFILNHSAKNLNSSKNIKVDKMFHDIKKEIYQRKLESGIFIYNLNYDPLKQAASAQQDNLVNSKTADKRKINPMTDSMRSSRRNDQKDPFKMSRKNDQNDTIKNELNKSILQIIKVGAIGEYPSSQTCLKSLLEESTMVARPQIQKPKPLPLDEVLQIFRKTNENVFHDYHQKKYDPALHEEYEKKLLSYGEAKEKQVLEYNKKQTYQLLSSTLPNFTEPKDSTELNPESVLSYLASLKTSGLPLNHDRAKPVSQKLKDLALYAKKHQFFHVWMTEAHYKQRKLQMAVEDKKKELKNLRYNKYTVLAMNNVQGNQAEELKDQHNRSTDKIEKVKTELSLSKKFNTNRITEEEYLKELEKHKNRLENALKENDKKLRQISLTPSKDPRINLLQQKLDDKKTMELQIEAGLSNIIHSRLNNSSVSVLSARKSQIRRIDEGGIRKSHINKSMTK